MIKGDRIRVEIDLEGVVEYASKDHVCVLFDDGRDVWLPKSFIETIELEPPIDSVILSKREDVAFQRERFR